MRKMWKQYMAGKIRIVAGGKPADFLKFCQRHPKTKTAKDYRDQIEIEACIPVDEAPSQSAHAILEDYVSPDDYDLYFEEVLDYEEVER